MDNERDDEKFAETEGKSDQSQSTGQQKQQSETGQTQPSGGADEGIDNVAPALRVTSKGGCPAPTTVACPLSGSSATHIAVMKERAPKMLRKSLFTARMIVAGLWCSTLPC